jgi:hypothetical protein
VIVLPIDPKIFAAVEERLGMKFPKRGTPILAKNRNGHVIAGNVGNVWIAMDTVCIDVDTVGGTARIYPQLGDKFMGWPDDSNA